MTAHNWAVLRAIFAGLWIAYVVLGCVWYGGVGKFFGGFAAREWISFWLGTIVAAVIVAEITIPVARKAWRSKRRES